MTIDNPWNMDPTGPTSNSNVAGANIAENCAPSGLNNAIRALAGMLAQATSYQSAAISASVSTNIAATGTGLVVPITGANAINSFGVLGGPEQPSAAVFRILQFSSSASLSNGASLILRGGASRRTQPGDIGLYFHAGSSDVWHEIMYSGADGALGAQSISVTTITNRSMSTSAISTVTLNAGSISVTTISFSTLFAASISASVVNSTAYRLNGVATNQILGTAFAMTQAAASSSSDNIPFDNTIPQIGEGSKVFSIAFTPKNAASVIMIDVTLHVSGSTAGAGVMGTLFKNADADAIAVGGVEQASNDIMPLTFSYAESASNTTLRSYTCRYGSDATAVQLNKSTAGDTFGGKVTSSMKITEIL